MASKRLEKHRFYKVFGALGFKKLRFYKVLGDNDFMRMPYETPFPW